MKCYWKVYKQNFEQREDALKENNIGFRRQKVEIPAGLIGGVINHPRLSPPQPGSAIERSSLGCEDQRNWVQERGKFRRTSILANATDIILQPRIIVMTMFVTSFEGNFPLFNS